MDNLHDPSANVFIRENTVCSLENVRAGRWWVMVTSAFQHNDFIHLGFNMITLWSFGPLVVSAFGVPAFLAIYATSQTVCTAAFLGWQVRKEEVERWSVGRRWGDNGRQQQKWLGWLYPKTDVDPGTRYFGSVGASGALSGLIAAWACFAPRSRVAILFVPMLAYKEMVAFVAGSLICMEGGYFPWIAHEAHLGGTVGGILSYYALVRPWIRRIR